MECGSGLQPRPAYLLLQNPMHADDPMRFSAGLDLWHGHGIQKYRDWGAIADEQPKKTDR